jgi:16S rRNA (guanine527-N7)-methyltransferase
MAGEAVQKRLAGLLAEVGSEALEQNPSDRALGERDAGGFFLRKKPLEGIASADSNSDFALSPRQLELFGAYYELFVRWNERINLSAIRDEEGILRRHFLESIGCARLLPKGVETLLDFGSGGGFPGVPVAICRPGIAVTLAESQGKKAAFLQEAVRVLGLNARVHSARAETLGRVFDCVTLRAVDRMEMAVTAATGLVRPGGTLALMTTRVDFGALAAAAGKGFLWGPVVTLPGSERGILALGRREPGSAE